MSFIVLKISELRIVLTVFFIVLVLILALYYLASILLNYQGINFEFSLFKALSLALSLSVPIIIFLAKSIPWKYPLLSNLFGKPSVHGLWEGTLISNFKKNGVLVPPIKIYFYVKQTYFAISLKAFTSSVTSNSTVAGVTHNSFDHSSTLFYNYELQRPLENRITRGSANLQITENSSKLEGIYWTSMGVIGKIELQLIDRNCKKIDSYSEILNHKQQLKNSS